MEKIETKTKQIEDRTHYFYCDDCGRYIGYSNEHEDGYYQELGELDLNWFTPNGWYTFEKCLCASCRDKFLANLYKILEDTGFKPD